MPLQVWLPLNGNLENRGLKDTTNISLQNGNPTYDVNGKVGNCFYNNASGSNITIPYEFYTTNKLSITFWVKPDTPNNWMDLFSIGQYANRMETNNSNGDMYYLFHDNEEYSLADQSTAVFPLSNGIWHHIAYIVDGTNIKIYKNGILVSTAPQRHTLTQVIGNNHAIFIGRRRPSESSYYKGYFNDIRIYDHALSNLEVKQISQGLVCHYPLKSQYETGQANKYSGDVAEGYLTGNFTRTKLENDRGYNYKLTYTGTGSNMWFSMKAGNFSFTAGKKYYYSCKVRCHSTNFKLTLRASRSDNDWVTNSVNVLSKADGEWHEYYVSQTINSTYDRSGSTVTCNPTLEFYTENLATSEKVYSADFDIKDVQVIESDCYVPFIDNSMASSVVSDCSGYGNNGTKVGTITWSGDSARYSGSYDFNGTGYIKNTSFNFNATQMTIAFWIKIPETTTNQHFLFGTFNNWTGNGIGYWRDRGYNGYSGIIRSNAESSHIGFATPTLTPNIWYHIGIVYTGTECIMYINGEENKRATYGNNGSIINPVCYLGNSLFNGTPSSETDESSIVDFRIYATALSVEDIKALYNISASIDKTGVLSAYEFSEFEEV